jgi:hypothetical protein
MSDNAKKPAPPPKRNYSPNRSSPFGWKWGATSDTVDVEPNSIQPLQEGRFVRMTMLTLGILALLAAAVAIAFVLWKNNNENTVLQTPEPVKLEGRALVAASKTAVTAFYGANSIEKRLPFVSEADRVEPLMHDHYSRYPLDVRIVRRIELMTSVTRYETRHTHSLASVFDSEDKVSLVILRESTSSVAIDWEALVAYNPMSLGEIKEKAPADAQEVRVMLKRSDYYNFGYEDSAKWQAFSLINPNEGDVILVGYAERGGEEFNELMALTENDQGAALRLLVQATAKPGQNVVRIEKIAAPHWLGGDA